jgi:hypothetical protein
MLAFMLPCEHTAYTGHSTPLDYKKGRNHLFSVIPARNFPNQPVNQPDADESPPAFHYVAVNRH